MLSLLKLLFSFSKIPTIFISGRLPIVHTTEDIYANPVIFWVPVARGRWKWSSDPCLITETKQLEHTVRCLYVSHHKVFTVNDEITLRARFTWKPIETINYEDVE